MAKQILPLLLMGIFFHCKAEAGLTQCHENIVPLEPLSLEWPGLPAGGVKSRKISETVTLKFIVNTKGKAQDIEVVNSTSRAYVLAARRTIYKTRFHPPKTMCFKYMEVHYEGEVEAR